MKNELNNKEKLIEYLSFVRDTEAEKPIGEMDNDLIEACVELLLELQGKTVALGPEQIEERVRKIPFVDTATFKAVNTKGKVRKTRKKRILLIAAVITILVTLLSIVSIAFEWNIFDALKDKFGSVFNTPIGVEQRENGISFENLGEIKEYENIEQLLKNEGLDVLIPTNSTKDITVKTIKIYNLDGIENTFISFNLQDLSCVITSNQNVSTEVISICDEVIEINNLQCYVVNLEDVNTVQIYFTHNNNCYKYTYNDKQVLLEIIENLEELQ